MVTGTIEGYAEIDPPRISLSGLVGETLSQQVSITPNPKHPFKIKEAKARTDQNIRLDLKPDGKDPARKGYLLTVTVIKPTAGAFADYIQLQTDLKEKPTMGISVHGRLLAPPAEGDGKKP